MLKVTKLNKYYHNPGHKPLHIINNTTVEIPETGIIAVIGESGAGKTTLINTISGLDSFKNGTITFDDVKMSRYNNRKADKLRLDNYGFIFQNYYLLEKQTVYENVAVSLAAFNLSDSEKKKRINYVLNQLGIAKYTNKLVTSLSGGEQQRVSIARALVKSPRIIFADEPTGSLDEKTTFNVLNILKKVSKTCAVFIVTHERELISYYADYIIELKEGVVIKEFVPQVPEGRQLAVDRNVYLGDLKHIEQSEQEQISLDLYSDQSTHEKGAVKIAIRNSKIYLEASEDIVVLGKDSENHLVDGKPRLIKDYVKDDFEYSLERPEYHTKKFHLGEIFKQGFSNFRRKKPIKTLLKIVCVVFSILLMVAVESINTIQHTNLSDCLTCSQGNIVLNVSPNGEKMTNYKLLEAKKRICEEVETSELDGQILFTARDTLQFYYDGFYQIQKQQFPIPRSDFKDIKTFNPKSLVFGKMPSNGFEIVIDEYVLENFLNSCSLKNIVTDYGYFVGKTLSSNYYKYELTISGVCRTKNPTIYGHETINFFRLSHSAKIMMIDLDYAKTQFPGLEGVTIQKGHCLRNTAFSSLMFDALEVDSFFNEYPYDIIINKDDYLYMKKYITEQGGDIYISTDGNKATIDGYLKLLERVRVSLAEDDIFVRIDAQHTYQNEYDEAVNDMKNILVSVEIVSIVMGVVTFLLIVLSTYLSMLSQISDIAVYRSLGYSRLYLGMQYFVELALLSLAYCLVGGVLAYVSMFILDVIPIVDFVISTPFIQFVGVVFGLAALVMIIGIIPIALVFRLTPAKIYSRYNRRINNV